MKATIAFALFLEASAALASAQTQPNFSGTWVVEHVERSERPGRESEDPGRGFGRGRGLPPGGAPTGGGARGGGRAEPIAQPGVMAALQQGQRVRIAHTADRLIVTTPAPDGEQMMSFALDGSETTNILGSSAVKSRTKWEGVALVTDTTQKVEGRGAGTSLTMREVRSISPDNRMVVRTTITTPRGGMTTTVTYAKVE